MKHAYAVVVLAALTSATTHAQAYRTASDTAEFAGSPPVRWPEQPITFRLSNDFPGTIAREEIEAALTHGFSVWGSASCTGAEFSFEGWTTDAPAAEDGVNTIGWVHQGWVDRGYDPTAAAFTDIGFRREAEQDWQIVEADIYVNADAFDWVAGEGSGEQRDIRSVLLHELGHALGLLHPCEDEATDEAPACSSVPDAQETVMYPLYDATKLSLSADDEAGLCFLYPKAECKVSCPDGFACIDQQCHASCGDVMCRAGELCGADGCVQAGNPGAQADAGPPACGNGTVGPALCGRPSPDGDPCIVDAECESGECHPDGYCAPTCSSDSDCEPGISCKLIPGSLWGICWTPRRPLGANCDEAAQCLGNQCLTGSELGDVCSRECGKHEAECPSAWTCKSVADRSVCVPPARDSGCQLAVERVPTSWGRGLLALVIGIGAGARRRLQSPRREVLGRAQKAR